MQSVIKLTQYVCYVSQITIDKFMKKYKINYDMEITTLQFNNQEIRPIAIALSVLVEPDASTFVDGVDFDRDLAKETLDNARRLNAGFEGSQLPTQSTLYVRHELAPALIGGLGFVRSRIESDLANQRFWADFSIKREMRRNLKTIAGITGALALAE